MFTRILSFFQTIKKISFYDKFTQYGMDSYIEAFQAYYKENPEEYVIKLEGLLNNLASVDQNNILRFLETILKLPLPSEHFLIKYEYLHNLAEIKKINIENKFLRSIQRYYKKYNLKGFEKLEINIFKYHFGLKLLSKEVKKRLPHSIFIDGGAFFGDSCLVMQKYKPAKIICFEPNSVNFQLLKDTVKNNGLRDSVILENYGLNDKISTLTMNYISHKQNHGASFIFKPKKHLKEESCPLVSIDEYLENANIRDRVGLIKLDVEGLGLNAILGGLKTIKKHKPIISCALYHNPEELFEIKPLLEKINPEYKFMIVPLNQASILKDLTLLAY